MKKYKIAVAGTGYVGLSIDQGVISADEFEDMKSKIKKGEL